MIPMVNGVAGGSCATPACLACRAFTAVNWSRSRPVLELASGDEPISKLFYDKPLVCHMRRLVQPTFQDWSFDNERYFNSNARFEDFLSWRREIEGARSELEWRGCDCPVCGSGQSIFAYRDKGDEKKLVLKFENFLLSRVWIFVFRSQQ